jgi:hypothetical protein
MVIEVFKTNVESEGQASELEWVLRHREIASWSFDLDDCDKVLRVMSKTDVADFVISTLTSNGFECCKLEW